MTHRLKLAILSLAAILPTPAPAAADNGETNDGRTIVSGTFAPNPDAARNQDARYTHKVDKLAADHDVSGRGIKVGIWDHKGVRTTHLEFREQRVRQKDGVNAYGDHAIHVAGTVGACGETCDGGKVRATGMAPGVSIVAFDYKQDFAEIEQAAGEAHLSCSTHSYGYNYGWKCDRKDAAKQCLGWGWVGDPTLDPRQSAGFGRYNSDSRTIDRIVHEHPEVAVFKAAGNGRNLGPTPDAYPEQHWVYLTPGDWIGEKSTVVRPTNGVRGGFETLEGMAVAKNVITIGAIHDITSVDPRPDEIEVADFSAFGPTDDGRIKPDLVANGFSLYSASDTADDAYQEKSGTSMATPAACGICALLNELAVKKRGKRLAADELKAVLIHTAMSPNPGPSYQIGWGSIRADHAGEVIADTASTNYRMVRGEIGGEHTRVTLSGFAESFTKVRATLVWIDPPAAATPGDAAANDARRALVNDLDLVLVAPDGRRHLPWTLALERDDLSKPAERAVRAVNRVDNVERVDVISGSEEDGDWTVEISVSGPTLDALGKPAPQRFALVVEGLRNTVLASDAPRTRRALLIGVQDYADADGFSPLAGSINDIRLIRTVLLDHLGMPAKDIRTLIDGGQSLEDLPVDGPASHCGIRAEFMRLINQDWRPGDRLYVHYSGHGSQLANPVADEAGAGETEKWKQTWVSWGARADPVADVRCPQSMRELDAYDVLDDEINGWLAELDDQHVEVVLVSDSCHSATVTRDAVVGLRTGPADTRAHPAYDPDYQFHGLPRAVRIGAAYDRDKARESTIDDQAYGDFTWFWAEALANADAATTWEDAFERAAARVRVKTFGSQRPNIWGERKTTEIASGRQATRGTLLAVTHKEGDHIITLNGGRLVGVTPGSTFRRVGEVADTDADQPVATIDTTTPHSSDARIGSWEGADSEREVRVGDLFREEQRVHSLTPVSIWVAADAAARTDEPALAAIRKTLEKLQGFRLADARDEREIEVYLTRHGQVSDDGDLGRRPPAPDPEGPRTEIWILDPNQDLIHPNLRIPMDGSAEGRSRAMRDLRRNLITLVKRRQLLELADLSPGLEENMLVLLEILVHSSRPGGIETPEDCDFSGIRHLFKVRKAKVPAQRHRADAAASARPRAADQRITLARNDCLEFKVRNNSNHRDVYAYLFNVTPDARVCHVFPYDDDPEQFALVERDRTRDYALPDAYGTYFRAEHEGSDHLILLVTLEPLDVGLLTLSGYQTRTSGVRAGYNPLESLLMGTMYTRGQDGDHRPTVPEHWSATRIALDVQ